jgi:Ca-activated chloride channel family protein
MRRRALFPTGLTLALLLAAPAPRLHAGPDTPSPAGKVPEYTEEVSVGYVLVPVVVRSGSGFAERLKKDDFKLLIDGRPVRIESFERRAEAPASLVFLQDLSGSMATGEKLAVSRQALRFFLDRSLPGDEFALATFASGRGQVEVPFTQERSPLYQASDLFRGYGTTALHDAVAWLPEISLEAKNPRRFALLITDGADNASEIRPEQAREMVRAAELPVYVLGLGAGSPFVLGADGKKLYRYADVLQLLATTTGGRYYPISQTRELQEALTAIAEDLRHQYVLGFATGDGRKAYRRIDVQVAGSRQTVFYRRGYQGPPPAGSS